MRDIIGLFLLSVIVLRWSYHCIIVLSRILDRDLGGLIVSYIGTDRVADGVVGFIKLFAKILIDDLFGLHKRYK